MQRISSIPCFSWLKKGQECRNRFNKIALCAAFFFTTLKGVAADTFDPLETVYPWATNGVLVPSNQALTPSGIQVNLPEMRPQVLLTSNAGGAYFPTIIKAHFPEANTARIGLLSALPYLCAAIGMVLFSVSRFVPARIKVRSMPLTTFQVNWLVPVWI